MKRAIVIVIALSVASACSLAQKYSNVDFDSVKLVITDSTGPWYYPVLMKRYLDFDPAITKEEYSLLYYGWVFQKGYDPYGQLWNKTYIRYRDSLRPGDNAAAYAIACTLLSNDPLNLEYNRLAYASCWFLQDTIIARKYGARWASLCNCIIRSEDGESAKTAYVITRIPDEYEVLRMLGLELDLQGSYTDSTSGVRLDIDRIFLKPNRRHRKEVLFNKNLLHWKLNQMYENSESAH